MDTNLKISKSEEESVKDVFYSIFNMYAAQAMNKRNKGVISIY